jgi:branched-chain amino acid transport system substrate-binding protein
MQKKLPLPALIAIILALAGCAAKPAPPASGEPVKIGAGFALTGDESILDLPACNGAKLAARELNAHGGVLGRPVELVIRDTQYKMDITAQIAGEFAAQKVVAVVGFTDTDSVMAAGPIIQKAGLPFITAGATSPKIPEKIGDKMFLACFGDNVQAAAGAEFALGKFGKNAVLIIDSGAEYTRLLGAYFKTQFTAEGGRIVLEDTYPDKTTSVAAQIDKIKNLSHRPDFYYIAAMPYNVGAVIKQFRDAGLNGPIVGGDGYDTSVLVPAAGAAAENVYFTTHALMDEKIGTKPIKKFMAAYSAEYGRPPQQTFSALGYDALLVLADAINRAGSTDPAAIQKALEATRHFHGVTGTISFTPQAHVPLKSVTIIAIKNGAFTLAAELEPLHVPAP